jgi:cysteine desulfurase family protein (TIGR01976 family)
VIDAISDYLKLDNANTAGAYATSRRTDSTIAGARSAMADFLNCDLDEVVFGPNMTSLTFAISRSIGRELGPGDEIVLTHLDHDANISPWRALEERGVSIRMVEIHEDDCTLDMDDLARKITDRTKLVAVGYASNAVGTINDVREIIRLAHERGAMAYIDAVHYAPHGQIDVRALDCDFLACSTYKFFGPHMGVLYGKREHLKRLEPYKVRANTNAIPNRWEWGTLNHECIAGITACVDYLTDLGRRVNSSASNRRAAVLAAYEAIQKHERELMESLIRGLAAIPGLKLYGISDPKRFDQRCPTLAVRIKAHTPLELATRLGERGLFTWDGNYYALNLTERLDVEKDGGFLRIGLAHYNTAKEVERFLAALREIAV